MCHDNGSGTWRFSAVCMEVGVDHKFRGMVGQSVDKAHWTQTRGVIRGVILGGLRVLGQFLWHPHVCAHNLILVCSMDELGPSKSLAMTMVDFVQRSQCLQWV